VFACHGVGMKSGTGLDVCQAIHAEQNALMQCRDIMQIDVVVVTTSPCMHCMKMLMNTSAHIIVYEEAYDYEALQLWRESFSQQGKRIATQTDATGHAF
jgi:dCMP deaminase